MNRVIIPVNILDVEEFAERVATGLRGRAKAIVFLRAVLAYLEQVRQ